MVTMETNDSETQLLNRVGSPHLKFLLSRNTPIGEKIEAIQMERSNKKGEEPQKIMEVKEDPPQSRIEKRITRSQANLKKTIETGQKSNDIDTEPEISEGVLQRMVEVGMKCGMAKAGQKEISRKSDRRRGEATGNK